MMRKLLNIFLLLVLLSSCTVKESKTTKISSSGKTSEMLVVVPNKHWEGSLGDTIKGYFGQAMPGLAWNEKLYDLVQMRPAAFSDLFKKHRNIFMIELNKESRKNEVEVFKDQWSQPQTIVRMKCSHPDSAIALFNREKARILERFNSAERERMKKAFRGTQALKVNPQLKEKLNISMFLPQGFYVGVQQDNFFWLRRKAVKYDHEMLVFDMPYTDTAQFNPDYLVEALNAYGKKYVPAHTRGSHLQISPNFPVWSRNFRFKGHYTVELRGQWETSEDFMGGPFLAYAILDEVRNRIVVIDGFVYHPNNPKRDHMRQIEGMILSLQFPEEYSKDEPKSLKEQRQEKKGKGSD